MEENELSDLADLMREFSSESFSTFMDLLKEMLYRSLSEHGLKFEDLVIMANPSTMPGASTNTAYYDGRAILEWKSPVVIDDGDTLRFEWVIKKVKPPSV